MEWFTAKAQFQGKPLQICGRRVPLETQKDFPILYVIEYSYDILNSIELPSEEQYDAIDSFEERVLDEIEKADIGRAAFIQTGRGKVKYYIYLSNRDSAIKQIGLMFRDDDRVELFSDDDPDWSIANNFLSQCK